MTDSDILLEHTADLPISITVKKQSFGRYQFTVNDKNSFNFYEKEELWLLSEDGKFTFIVARNQPKPTQLRLWLKKLIGKK